MKNNIGRKLTSLTLMTIMFAGGMTVAAPGVMPDVFAEGATSPSGLVSISSAKIQGASILEIVIDDPSISALDSVIGIPTLTFVGTSTIALTPAQGVDGKWYSYIVDEAQSDLADAMSGLNFGNDCGATLTLDDGKTIEDAWALATGACDNPDGPLTEADNGGHENNAWRGQVLEVLNDAPSLNRNTSANGGGQIQAGQNSTLDAVQRPSGGTVSAWPFIEKVNMASDNFVKYGGEQLPFEWGNMNDDIEISFIPDTYANGADINLVITDNGLNIDPTDLDQWKFETLAGAATIKRTFSNTTSGVDGAALTSLSTIGFGEASLLTATGDTGSFCTTVATLEETGDATGVFTTPDSNGNSDCDTSATATNHDQATYTWGGESATVHIKYVDGSITMDAGDAWLPAEAATVTISDPDANRVNNYDETMGMSVLNAATTIPYIKTGSPQYLGLVGTPTFTVTGDEGEENCADTAAASGGGELGIYELTMGDCDAAHDTTEIIVEHDVLLSTLSNMTGTVVMNYDVSSFYDALGASSMSISLGNLPSGAGGIANNIPGGSMIFNVTGPVSDTVGVHSGAGIVDLKQEDSTNWFGAGNADSEGVVIKFLLTHQSDDRLGPTTTGAGPYPIAVDFFNFNSTAGTADALYRLEVEEDGTDGVFTGNCRLCHDGL